MKLVAFLAGILLIPFSTLAQSQSCGTEPTGDDLRLIMEMRQRIDSGRTSSRDFGDGLVPVKYHIIAADDSSMGMDTALMYAEMEIVQQRFAPIGIEFYQCGEINYIYDSDYVDFEKYTSEDLCDVEDEPNVLNIWFADNVYKLDDGDVVSICGYAYLSGPNDRIIIDNDCGDNSSTLVHEIGHYFSLLHTHSTSGLGEEFVDGSNCLVAGDLLCDTPADPRLSSSTVNSSCVYTGTETDSQGDPYEPDPENIMSYSRKHCRVEFSDDQLDQMLDYLINYRNYLSCGSITGINEGLSEESEISVYPNPFINELRIQFSPVIKSSNLDVLIQDVQGKVVYSKSVSGLKAGTDAIWIMDIQNLDSGVYFIIINGEIGNVHSKIVRL